MSKTKRQGFETVDSEGEHFVFRANFGFLEQLKQLSDKDPMLIAELVSSNDPSAIRDTLIASLDSRADASAEEMTDEEKKDLIELFITRHGLQECSILAQHLLSHSMIGDIKKNQIDQNQTITGMIDGLLFSRSKIFKNHVLLWGYILLIFGIYQCTTTKFIMPLIAASLG